MATPNQTTVTELYIAAFGRSPDADGLDYWVGRLEGTVETQLSIDEISYIFFATDEGLARFPSNMETGAYVDLIYNNVLGREPDAEGRAFWIERISSGAIPREDLVLRIVQAATSETANERDSTYFANRTEVALAFAAGGFNDVDDAEAVLEGVDETPEGLQKGLEAVDALEVVPEPNFILTTGIDNIASSASELSTVGIVDSNNAVSTLNAGDRIVGTNVDGDELRVVLEKDYAGTATIIDIDSIKVQNGTSAAQTFNATGVTGADEIISNASVGALTIENIATLSTQVGIANSSKSLEAYFASSALTGSSDEVTLTLSNATGTGAQDVTVSDGIEQANIVSNGTTPNDIGEIVDQNNDAAAHLAKFVITGDNDLRLRDTLDAETKTIDASAFKGDLRLDGADGGANMTITGGDGNDTVIFGAGEFTKDDTVNLGGGDNVLDVSLTASVTDQTAATNVDTLAASSDGAWTLNTKGMGVTGVRVDADGAANSITLTNLSLIQTAAYQGDKTDADQIFDNLNLNFSATATSGTNDSVAVSVGNQGEAMSEASNFVLGTLTANGIENLTITAADGDIESAGGGATGLTITDNTLATLTVSSTKDVNFDFGATSTEVKSINVGGVEGKAIFSTLDFSNNVSIVLSQGGSQVTVADNSGNAKNVTITAGDGDDTIVMTTGFDTDTMTVGGLQVGDRIDISDFTGGAALLLEVNAAGVNADGDYFYNNANGILTVYDNGAGAAVNIQLDAGLDTTTVDIVGVTSGANDYIQLVAV